jgi:hypothetical protein
MATFSLAAAVVADQQEQEECRYMDRQEGEQAEPRVRHRQAAPVAERERWHREVPLAAGRPAAALAVALASLRRAQHRTLVVAVEGEAAERITQAQAEQAELVQLDM